MGYTTDFEGEVWIEPPLNAAEVDYLKRFSDSRRMIRAKGPYYAEPGSNMGQGKEDDVFDYNAPPAGQPGLWCKWIPSAEGLALVWNGVEKFYDSLDWMVYLIDHFLKPGAEASLTDDPQFGSFTFDHVLNGTIDAQGEDPSDRWRLVVKDNVVSEVRAKLIWPDPEPTVIWPDEEDQ